MYEMLYLSNIRYICNDIKRLIMSSYIIYVSYLHIAFLQAGYFSKALELAFSSKEYSALQMVSESLDDSADPHLLQRCADFFNENSQFDRAVDLLAAAKRVYLLHFCHEPSMVVRST